MSTRTRLRWRMVAGISTLMAAIGSSVSACISSWTLCRAECMESMTCRGRKVAMTVAEAMRPRWPTRVFSWVPSSSYFTVL